MATLTTQLARLSVLNLEMPGDAPVSAGVLLQDPATNQLYLRLRRDWDVVAPAEAAVLSELESDLKAKAQELGAERVLDQLQDTLSNTLTISPPRDMIVEDFGRAVERLYRDIVRSTVRPFKTHLPVYSLAVAAGKFLENHEVEEEGWEEIPAGLNPTPAMFVARIAGRSMEPRIPDGSLCVFRAGVVGSRQGKLVLVERFGAAETSARYTIKKYTSTKQQTGDDEWQHSTVRLEPLNKEFEGFDLKEGEARVIAEFIQVLE
jgi:SOS-response transcriptional repressor LexA